MNKWTQRFEYIESYVESYAPELAGVYRLIYNLGDKYYVFYVGQSNNLRRRLREHLDVSESDSCIKKHLQGYRCFFRYVEIDSQEERNKVEAQSIEEYNPTCNSKVN